MDGMPAARLSAYKMESMAACLGGKLPADQDFLSANNETNF
jgi:hypothetical protein